ncbi:uncharacterized protein LOC132746464 isoform X2 [Ruditapes philippinarum]|uniref:uncharacterized protein LOC132746464 isoform X2 n=1 Tax=Ruditapes philippinarum TaxID=129788 RepID=UPI00295C176F|nr:uncharacterized protein LOC132746464 isoform X2 [Ruditapes philippinarum]
MAVAQETRLQHNLKMEPGIERPQSALGARGVQITEFKEACINPEPIVIEETDLLLEQFLSPRKLMLLTGVDNLDDIRHLEMKVNTTDTSLGNFGQLLQNLTQLKVSNSTIPRIRDLGSSLRSLHVLWASRCSLTELDGISSMCNLRELYLSYNEICDISALSMLDQIEILDLEGNNLDDIMQVQYLAICGKLTNLTLDGNPLCITSSPDDDSAVDYDYRQAVKKAIPHLKYLDDELLIEGVGSFQKHNVFDADWAYLEELTKEMTLDEDEDAAISDSSRPPSGNRPSTAALRPNTGYRPGSALRPSSGFRPMTAGVRPASSGARPATAIGMRPTSGSGRPSSGGKVVETTDASDLTMGKVICGNPSKALLSRRRLNPDAAGELDNGAPEITFEPKVWEEFKKFQHKAEHTYDALPEESRDRSEIVDELKAWKQEHEKRMAKIRVAKAPQVLKIDHDDAVSLSGDSEVESDEEELSPFKDEELIHKVRDENNIEGDENFSTFVPVSSSQENFPTKNTSISKTNNHDIDHKVTSTHVNRRKSLSEDDDSDTLYRASSAENKFRISEIKDRQKASIPPPSQRDIVRKHIDTQSQVCAQSPLGSFLGTNPVANSRSELRSTSGLRVNSTGLPRPPSSSGVPIIGKRDSLTKDPASPLIRSGLMPPSSQRPSTARAALAISSQPKMRRSLPTVPSLPSKPMAPPK